MNYDQCKQALYSSKAIANVPDNWAEELPFLMMQGGQYKIAYLYSIKTKGKAIIKKLITVDTETFAVEEFSIDSLKRMFHLRKGVFEINVVSDYNHYFCQKERYEILFSRLIETDFHISQEELMEYIQLVTTIFSKDQFSYVIYPLGKQYFDQLKKVSGME